MSFLTKICCVSLLFCHLNVGVAWAQSQTQPSLPDSLTPNTLAAYDTALSQYHAYLAPETGLFRGSEYGTYDLTLREGQPYFGEKRRRPGTVSYNHIFYDHVMLLYDEVKDLVIMYDYFNLFKITLFPEMVDRFSIENHRFIRLTDSLNPTQPRNGYYEVLYQGRMMLLKKEKKIVQEDLNSGPQVQFFIEGADTAFYLKKGNSYYPVNNTKSLLHALKDRSRDVKKFIRSNGLSVRKDRENTLIKVSAWYDNSSPQ